jgi:hypothetical protein
VSSEMLWRCAAMPVLLHHVAIPPRHIFSDFSTPKRLKKLARQVLFSKYFHETPYLFDPARSLSLYGRRIMPRIGDTFVVVEGKSLEATNQLCLCAKRPHRYNVLVDQHRAAMSASNGMFSGIDSGTPPRCSYMPMKRKFQSGQSMLLY